MADSRLLMIAERGNAAAFGLRTVGGTSLAPILCALLFCGCPSTPSSGAARPKAEPIAPPELEAGTPLFALRSEEVVFFKHHAKEHQRYGRPSVQKKAKTTPYGGTVVEQRSGRKRLYDHNILLRGFAAGRVEHLKYGDLGRRFRGAVFVDIGSAILFGEGAPTVRDLFEDQVVREYLGAIVATDINDKQSRKTRYIDRFRSSGRELPFPLREIPLLLSEPEHFRQLTQGIGTDRSAWIFRSASSGPDLYYTVGQAREHLTAVRAAAVGRDVIYLFNRFVLFKPAEHHSYNVLGTSSADVGLNHRSSVWEKIRWKRRRLDQAFRVDASHIRILAARAPESTRKASPDSGGSKSSKGAAPEPPKR